MDMSSYRETDHQKKIEEKYADELSVGSYTWKNFRGLGITFGTAVAGYFLGKGVAQWTGKADKVFHPKFLHGMPIPAADLYKWGAGYVGLMVGSIFSTYDIWKKKESAQLAVQELNEDVTRMLAIRAKTNPDLVKEMDSLRGMYDELKTENTSLRSKLGLEGPRTPGEQARERGPLSHTEQAESQALETTEAAR